MPSETPISDDSDLERGSVRLAGMPMPNHPLPWERVRDVLGISAIVSLTGSVPEFDCAPLLWRGFMLEDLIGRDGPTDPVHEWATLRAAVDTVRALLDDGVGTIVHCLGGRGRTGTVIGAVAVSYGLDAEAAAVRLDAIHQHIGSSWPECVWQREVLDRFS